MRYIILRTEVIEGKIAIFGLTELSHKASGTTPKWIDFKEAKTNCLHPEECDLLSFEEENIAQELLDNTGMIDGGNIAYIGVNA